jgi:hypothetical protein
VAQYISEQNPILHTPTRTLINVMMHLSHSRRPLSPGQRQTVDAFRAELRRREALGHIPCADIPADAPYPTISVIATPAPNGREWVLRYACPWCKPRRGRPIQHTHPGGPIDGPPADGWRTSHCPLKGRNGVPVGYTMVVRTADEPPVAFVTAEWSERSRYWALTVLRCPFCGKKHYHGGCSGPEPDLGFRASHCLEERGSYELVLAPALSLVGRRS